jgi:hypothetical protein
LEKTFDLLMKVIPFGFLNDFIRAIEAYENKYVVSNPNSQIQQPFANVPLDKSGLPIPPHLIANRQNNSDESVSLSIGLSPELLSTKPDIYFRKENAMVLALFLWLPHSVHMRPLELSPR